MAKHKFVTRTGRVVERDDNFRETLAPPASMYQEIVREDNGVTVGRPITALQMLVSWIAGILNALLAIRFVFSLLNVNQASGITGFIYNATNWMVSPFNGLFADPPTISTGYIDLPAVAAFIAVSLIAWAVIGLLRIIRTAS